ncbi:hypothetical protein ACRE_056730 [Hapsidospora chrysogenum ATCC 11550]|uniref:Altered inheritance of mitochondria protein 11 n=1 Tax=Hapsidospora chrysogenum (strain ATCC 11550 / CBS 779.69 / DSM 880 / IAM 14645 / JCM 23072 / IMI 49137) TaxID=857340 RepID=A0A086T2H3_HAPC1|nr:hypothetical protein ACRE_056730 [Hapsidospora chrysogenum ATCC 11550]
MAQNSPTPQHGSGIVAPSPPHSPPQSPLSRHLRQVGFCLAGAGFLAASIAVSRRSVLRLRASTYPPFYTSNRNPASKLDSQDRALIAVRAFGLATLNVMSFGVMLVGGISWAFDLSSVAELRERTKASLERSSGLSTEDEEKVEKELEKLLGPLYSKLGIPFPTAEEPNGKETPPGKDEGKQ